MNPVVTRALIVEDDRSWQQILTEMLTDAGLTVDVAGKIRKRRPRIRHDAGHVKRNLLTGRIGQQVVVAHWYRERNCLRRNGQAEHGDCREKNELNVAH